MRRAFLIGAILLAAWAAERWSQPTLLGDFQFSQAFFDRHGKLLRLSLTPDEKYRLWTPLAAISPRLVETTMLEEDRHFRQHVGFNPVSLVRAAYATYVKRGPRLGGSTLTMQLARLRFHLSSRHPLGKLVQIFRAIQLEWYYSKDEILEAYLNLAPYGLNIEGAGAASLIYFQHPASKLTLTQALTLAVLPQSPSLRRPEPIAPGVAVAPGLSRTRERLLERWIAEHPADKAKARELLLPLEMHLPRELPFLAPHFVEEVAHANPTPGAITTTLDQSLQSLVERQVRQYVEKEHHRGVRNAIALVVDSRSMEVRALVGSANYFDASIEGQVNGVRARRSPGSTLKPFLYALGIDQGLLHPLTMLKDTETHFGLQNPENSDRDFMGPISAKEALNRSRNLPALLIANQLHAPTFYEFLQQAIGGLREENFYGLGLVLGNAEISMEDLVRLYAMLPNGGEWRALKRWKGELVPPSKPFFSSEAADLVLEMLKDNPRPAQGYLNSLTRDPVWAAWKTGTSWGFRDAWSAAVFGPYVAAVWVGNFDGEGNPAFVGRDMAGPLLFHLVDAIHARERLPHPRILDEPKHLVSVKVCALSGQLPSHFCKQTVTTRFIPGKSPIRTCDIHREVWVDTRTGKRACAPGLPYTKPEVYEFWPSDLLKLFRRAGIPRRLPPPEDPSCSLQAKAQHGLSPEITSPVRHLVYDVRVGEAKDATIPLVAVSDGDVRGLYWFVDGKYVGKSEPNQALFWQPHPGKFTVRVVDDHGRSARADLKVSAVE